jgi:hypothetical protein
MNTLSAVNSFKPEVHLNVNVKLFPLTPWRNMERVDEKLHLFLTWTPGEGGWSASRLGRFTARERVPVNQQEAGWAPGPFFILLRREKSSAPALKRTTIPQPYILYPTHYK